MKKLLILVATILCIGCSQHAEQLAEDVLAEQTSLYTPEEEWCLSVVYNYCLLRWGEDIPKDIINNKIETIRWCEINFDPHGDNLCEMTEYSYIQHIIWPNRYNVL